jgi:hypothetical protein
MTGTKLKEKKMKNVTIKATFCLAPAIVTAVSTAAAMIFSNTPVLAGEQQARLTSGGQAPQVEKHSLSGPYAYKNLAIFLIQAKDPKTTTKFITLQQALEQKKATVSETGTVNNLVIENVADDVHIYIQSGDIVRGGKQDRTIGNDYVIAPKSGKIPLSSFCVESGRWRQRGDEKAHEFSASTNSLPSKGLKVAANYSRSQGGVWQEVADVQNKLSQNLGKSVKAQQSASSLELTLDDKDVKKAVQKYVDALTRLVYGRENVVGFVSMINGKPSSADMYASPELFRKLWVKLLRACAVEAIAELQETDVFAHPTVQSAAAFLQDDDRAKIHEKQVDEQLKIVTRQSKDKIVFETYRTGEQEALHKSYIRADSKLLQQQTQPGMQGQQTRSNITNSSQQQQAQPQQRTPEE